MFIGTIYHYRLYFLNRSQPEYLMYVLKCIILNSYMVKHPQLFYTSQFLLCKDLDFNQGGLSPLALLATSNCGQRLDLFNQAKAFQEVRDWGAYLDRQSPIHVSLPRAT